VWNGSEGRELLEGTVLLHFLNAAGGKIKSTIQASPSLYRDLKLVYSKNKERVFTWSTGASISLDFVYGSGFRITEE
jgi:hypothetical protein